MKYDVFISYAPKNIEMAKRVKQYLDAKGLKCWFDSESTHEKEAIISAIEASQIMLVLVSSRSDESHNLEREIILADVEGLAVLPVRIQDVSVQGLLRYLLADSQWIEVANDEINSQQLDLIAETIQSLKSKALRCCIFIYLLMHSNISTHCVSKFSSHSSGKTVAASESAFSGLSCTSRKSPSAPPAIPHRASSGPISR